MSTFDFGFLSTEDPSAPAGDGPPRLRDLIAGLRAGEIEAATLLDRLDPDLSDEVRALVAHRGVAAETFLASVLMAFALDVADETWRRMTSGDSSDTDRAEAAAFADLVRRAVRQTLVRGLRLEGETDRRESPARPGRRVG
jgi:hypothetical protein